MINTFREAVRDRVLYGVLGVALFILVFALALAELSLNQQRRVVLDIGLWSISFFSVIVAIFLGSSLLYKEIERKTLYVILPKPIRRHEFLLGKYFGIWLTAVIFITIMGAVQLWVTSVQADAKPWVLISSAGGLLFLIGILIWTIEDHTTIIIPWSLVALTVCSFVAASAGVKLVPILASLILSVGEVAVLAAVALLFSSFSSPFLTGIFSLGVWLAGRSADNMVTMTSSVLPDTIKSALSILVYAIPNFNLFVPGHHLLESSSDSTSGPLTYVATSMGYAAIYSAIVLTFAALIFRRRDFL